MTPFDRALSIITEFERNGETSAARTLMLMRIIEAFERGDEISAARFLFYLRSVAAICGSEELSKAVFTCGWNLGAETMRKNCAAVADQFDQGPGDDTPMGPIMVAQVEMAQRIRKEIRALPIPPVDEG